MSLSAGKINHFVRIERLVRTLDTNGDPVESWELVATVHAAIEPLSAREFAASQAMQSQVSARITIRFRDDVRAAMRIVHGSRIYNITGVLADKDSGREYLTLPVTEGTNEG